MYVYFRFDGGFDWMCHYGLVDSAFNYGGFL